MRENFEGRDYGLKELSLFSGIGAFEKALDNLEIPYELVAYCEIDKYASKSYAAIHGVSEDMNLGDITKVDAKKLPKDIDLLTYGFPCQDISLAGKQKGLFNEDGSQTRSGLFFEALRIIEETQPKVAIAENVKNLTSKKFNAQFQIVLESLEQAGYNNYWQVLNAKDYGVPQNRERVFIVSIRKDLDTGTFKFPCGFPLQLLLKDMLEAEVDEKYYINTERSKLLLQKLQETKQVGNERICCDSTINDPKVRDISDCITSRYDAGIQNQKQIGLVVVEPALIQVAQMYGTEKEPNPQAGRIYDADGISPTMDSCSGGNRMPKVLVREATKKGYAEAFEGDSINLEQPNSTTRRGRVGHGVAQRLLTCPQQAVVEPRIEVVGDYIPSGHDASRIVSSNGIAPTVKENHGTVTAVAAAMRGRYGEDGRIQQQVEVSDREFANALTTVQKDSIVAESELRIRKLTPKECFRLMGFDDADFEKAEVVNSNTQLYKQAGNSIVVPVLEHVVKTVVESGAWGGENT